MLPLVLAGGRAIRYSSMLTLDIRKRSIQEADPVSRDEGMKIGVTINKNHCRQDRMPYLKTEYFVVYGQGTERSIEIIELAEKCGILTKKGSWYREYSGETDSKGNPIERILSDGTKAAWNGMKNTRAYILSHPEYFDYLVNKVENFGQIDVETLSEEEIQRLEEEHKLEEASASEQDITLDDIIQDPDTTETKKSTKKKK
jgi:recombination protein RecA